MGIHIHIEKKCELCKHRKSAHIIVPLLPNHIFLSRPYSSSARRMINSLNQPDIFCEECYLRIRNLDKAYVSPKHSQKEKRIICYLFWMSIIWRMAIGKVCLHMFPDEQEKLRYILNLYLPPSYQSWTIPSPKQLGKCVFRLQKVQQLYSDDMVIDAVHETSCPYVAIIGPYVLKWYMSIDLFKRTAAKTGDMAAPMNTAWKNEYIEYISWLDYALDIASLEQTNKIYDRKMSSWIMRTLPDVQTILPFSEELRFEMQQPAEELNESYGNRVDVIDRS